MTRPDQSPSIIARPSSSGPARRRRDPASSDSPRCRRCPSVEAPRGHSRGSQKITGAATQNVRTTRGRRASAVTRGADVAWISSSRLEHAHGSVRRLGRARSRKRSGIPARARTRGRRSRARRREITWVIGGSPIVTQASCAIRARARRRRDHRVAEADAHERRRGLVARRALDASSRPRNPPRSARLRERPGARHAANIRALPDVEAPTDVLIWRVVTDTGLDAYSRCCRSASVRDIRRRRGYARCMHASALVPTCLAALRRPGRRRPGGCASVFLAAGVAGLYFVCTVPDARRRGIGAAISREALAGTLELGFDVGVLGSSPMGHRCTSGWASGRYAW